MAEKNLATTDSETLPQNTTDNLTKSRGIPPSKGMNKKLIYSEIINFFLRFVIAGVLASQGERVSDKSIFSFLPLIVNFYIARWYLRKYVVNKTLNEDTVSFFKVYKVVFVIFLIQIVFGTTFNGLNEIMGVSKGAPTITTVWSTQRFYGLSLDSPHTYLRDSELSFKLLSKSNSFVSVDAFSPRESKAPLKTYVAYFNIKEGEVYDMDKAAESGVNSAASKLGDDQPKYTRAPFKLNGKDALDVVYRPNLSTSSFRLRSIFIKERNRVWLIQILWNHDNQTADVEKIVHSISFPSK